MKNVPITKWSSSSTTQNFVRGKRDAEEKDVTAKDGSKDVENLKVGGKGSVDDDQNLTPNPEISYRNRTSIQDLDEEEENGSGHENKTPKDLEEDQKMKKEEEKEEVYQLCVCSKNGRIFMAPSDSSCSLPSVTTSGSTSSSDDHPDVVDALICS